jgi:hypothetical protein
MTLHDYLATVSPCTEIRLDNGEGSIFFYGYAGEITESGKFLDSEVVNHCFGKYGHDILYITIS